MIEIRTQSEFDAIISSTPPSQLIRIYPKETSKPYYLNTYWNLESNTHVEGIGKPKIQFTGVGIDGADTGMIQIKGTSSSPKENIIIKGLELFGKQETLGSFHGILVDYCGLSYSAGLNTGDYKRYDSSTVGSGLTNKIGVLIEDCNIYSFKTNGISLSFSHNSQIHNNVIKDTGNNGINLYRSNSNSIFGNSFVRTVSNGCFINESSMNNITNNFSRYSDNGIQIWLGESNIIANNTVEKAVSAGIYLLDATNSNTLINNRTFRCNIGIYSNSSTSNLISQHNSHNDEWGIQLESASYFSYSSSTLVESTNDAIALTSVNNIIISQNSINDTSPINIETGTSIISYSNNYQNIQISADSTVSANSNIQRT